MSTATTSRLALKNLPPFSPVATKLMALLRREELNFKVAADLIKSDAGLSAEVLRLANSSITGLRFPCSTMLHALSVLGVRQLASLTMTLCVGKLVRPVSRLPLMRHCWRHNLATALIARRWSEEHRLDSEDAYMFGLLAGIGQLAMLVSEPEAYCRLVGRAEVEGTPLGTLETDFFGFDNQEAARWLVEEWHLPHELLKVYSRPVESPLAQLISEASLEADRIGFSVVSAHAAIVDDPAIFEIAQSVNSIEQELGIY